MQERARRFRELARQQMGGRRGRGIRYPEALRVEAVAFARERLSSGVGLSSIAESLGLSPLTLSRWLRPSGPSQVGLRKVEVIAQPEPALEPVGAGMVVVTPSGYRVEGLELAQVAELLRTLG